MEVKGYDPVKPLIIEIRKRWSGKQKNVSWPLFTLVGKV
jgi:hypothetical protein